MLHELYWIMPFNLEFIIYIWTIIIRSQIYGSYSKLCSLSLCVSVSLKIWYTSRYKALLAPKGSNVYCKRKPYFAFTLVVYILVCEKTACIRVFKVCLIHLQECLFSRGHVSKKLIRTFNNI